MKIIKNNPINQDLARNIARLVLANNYLKDKVTICDLKEILRGMTMVRSSMEWVKRSTQLAGSDLDSATAAAYAIALMCESDLLIASASEKIRKTFKPIRGGKNAVY